MYTYPMSAAAIHVQRQKFAREQLDLVHTVDRILYELLVFRVRHEGLQRLGIRAVYVTLH